MIFLWLKSCWLTMWGDCESMSCQLNVRPFCQVLDVAVLVQRAEAALEARSLITHTYKGNNTISRIRQHATTHDTMIHYDIVFSFFQSLPHILPFWPGLWKGGQQCLAGPSQRSWHRYSHWVETSGLPPPVKNPRTFQFHGVPRCSTVFHASLSSHSSSTAAWSLQDGGGIGGVNHGEPWWTGWNSRVLRHSMDFLHRGSCST